MATMPCNPDKWTAKDYTALARRLIYAAARSGEITNDEELEKAKRFAACSCKLFLERYTYTHKEPLSPL